VTNETRYRLVTQAIRDAQDALAIADDSRHTVKRRMLAVQDVLKAAQTGQRAVAGLAYRFTAHGDAEALEYVGQMGDKLHTLNRLAVSACNRAALMTPATA